MIVDMGVSPAIYYEFGYLKSFVNDSSAAAIAAAGGGDSGYIRLGNIISPFVDGSNIGYS